MKPTSPTSRKATVTAATSGASAIPKASVTGASAASSSAGLPKASVTPKHSRKEDVFNKPIDVSSTFVIQDEPKKSDETLRAIFKAIDNSVVFKQLSDVECDKMSRAMKKKTCKSGEVLIKQGDKDSELFYVIEKGTFDYIVDGKKVGEGKSGTAFGELGLLYNYPRAATVIAKDEGLLWMLSRDLFRRIVNDAVSNARKNVKEILKKVPIVAKLSEEQLNHLCDIVQTGVKVKAGATIINKGDLGTCFYIIQAGTVECTEIGTTGQKLELGPGEYFGERALLKSEPRYANVIAKTDATLITIEKANFDRIFGGLSSTLDKNLGATVFMSVNVFNGLSATQKHHLVDVCKEKSFKAGEYIVKQGDTGDTFYIITDGSAEVYKKSEESGDKPVFVAKLAVGDYFGEGSLLMDEPRQADIIAKGPVRTLELERDAFDKVFDQLKGSMNQRLSMRKDQTDDAVKKKAHDIEKQIAFADLAQIRTLGTGTFGRVKLVENKALKKAYAMKILQKAQIVEYAQEVNVMNEKRILAECYHPFILRLVSTYKDQNCLYLLLELVQGGELFSVIHVHILPNLKDEHGMFYAGCVLDIFDYLHERSIVYRDLKPENLMIDDVGYIKMVDFGFAKKVPDKTYTLCGTPEYLAPEILLNAGHNKCADYWALGILIFELLTRRCPFADPDRMIMYEEILQKEPSFPENYSQLAKDLTKALLVKDQALRLGNLVNGIRDIKEHKWFTSRNLDFYELRRKRVQPPWVPAIKDYKDSTYFDNYSEDYTVAQFTGKSDWAADF